MLFAVIKTGGKQYKVQEGDRLLVEKLHTNSARSAGASRNAKAPMRIGEEFDFEEVLLVGRPAAEIARPSGGKSQEGNGDASLTERQSRHRDAKIGTPLVEGAKVRARVLEHAKGDKKIVFKYTRKTRYKKKKGHRQPYTKVEILKITA
jgi:large subunit ribosomal protein L21